MNEDAPESKVFENLVSTLYERHPIRVPILGTSESIREITADTLHLCHRAFYIPGNMMLCVIGDVDAQEVASIAEEILGKDSRPVAQKLNNWEETLVCPQSQTLSRMEVAMPMFDLAFKSRPLGKGDEAIRQEMIADLAAEALFGESSALYLKLYEEGVIDSSFGGGFETVDGAAMLLCSGDSESPEVIRQAILAQAQTLRAEGIGEDAFLRMKRSALGRRIRALDSFDSTCFRLCAYKMSDFDYFRFPEIYRDIRQEDVLAFIAETVKAEHSVLSVIEPLT